MGSTRTASIAICTSNDSTFFPRYLRRPADHEPGNEHRQHDEDEHSIHTGANSAEYDLAQHHIDEQHQAAQWCERIVH